MIEGTITIPRPSTRNGSKAQKAWARRYTRGARCLLRGVLKLRAAMPHNAFAFLMRRNGWDVKTVGRKAWRFKQTFYGADTIIELKEV